MGLILDGQKSSKMETFSKHEKHEKSMAGAANLRLEEGQKSIRIDRKKTEKKSKNRTPEIIKKIINSGVMPIIE